MGWLDNLYDSIFNENGNSDYNEIEERHSYRGYEQTGRRITSGWAGYDDLLTSSLFAPSNSVY